jgi:hypothetical protein
VHGVERRAQADVGSGGAVTGARRKHAVVRSAWLSRANDVTVRRLSDEVTRALNVQDVRPLSEPVAPPPAGPLVMPTDAQMRARFADETPEVVLRMRAPASVAALFEHAMATFTRTGEPRWRGFERLLDEVRAEWNVQPRQRDPIFAREGWRCAVPACSAQRNLHDHHIVFRSRSGDRARDNRVAICAAHHRHGLHGGGSLHAWGEAPDGICRELGIRRNASPLLTLIGDRCGKRQYKGERPTLDVMSTSPREKAARKSYQPRVP